MAIAPLNKFLTVAAPVAPGEQIIYTTPAGVSAILLYAQVANVGVNTYPKVTLSHRRKSTSLRTVGNTRNIQIAKEVEIPPNDVLILIDGRLVLERNAIITDSLVIKGLQSGITTITGCLYDNTTGITTITTINAHNFNTGDQVTMSGLNFSCSGSSFGLTTTVFPSPQKSFTIDSIVGEVGTSKTFVTNSGIVLGITHTYQGGGMVGPLQMEVLCSIIENSTT